MKKTNTHDLVLAALCAALTAVVAPFSIAIGPISLTLSVFAVLFTIYFFNLDMKFMATFIEPFLSRHYDRMPRNQYV